MPLKRARERSSPRCSDVVHDALGRAERRMELAEFGRRHRDRNTVGKLHLDLGRHGGAQGRGAQNLVHAPPQRLPRWADDLGATAGEQYNPRIEKEKMKRKKKKKKKKSYCFGEHRARLRPETETDQQSSQDRVQTANEREKRAATQRLHPDTPEALAPEPIAALPHRATDGLAILPRQAQLKKKKKKESGSK
jgi:hypothetical protein